VPVKAGSARKALAIPVEDTLLFAGEVTGSTGHGGTVHEQWPVGVGQRV